MRPLIVFLIVVGLGYSAYALWHSTSEEAQRREVREERRSAVTGKIKGLATKTNAVMNWAAALKPDGSGYRRTPVLTSELQALWVGNRPIILTGRVGDISTNSDGTYQILVIQEMSVLQTFFSGTRLQANLTCTDAIARPLIEKIRNDRGMFHGYGIDIAMAAGIDSIVGSSEKDLDGEAISVLTGVGNCIDGVWLRSADEAKKMEGN